ncbi:MAG: hypothetical protein WAK18_14150 [Nocardioidaceae bacterium]
MKFSRPFAAVGGLALSIVCSVGMATPASAVFYSDPLVRPAGSFVADGPVHSSVGSATTQYVGGQFLGGGGVASLNPSTGFANWTLSTNGDVRAMALSSDGGTLFIGGAFTTAGGATHRHLAAVNSTTGAVISSWKASTGGMVRDMVVRDDTLYVGGTFAKINSLTEKSLGAIVASTGKSLPGFTAYTDKNVYGMALTPSSLVITGNFLAVNGQSRLSIASIDLGTNQLTSWAPRRLCSGCNSYWDVVVDGTNAYVGTSGPGGNLGAFDLVTGNNPWRYVHADGDVQAVGMTGDGLIYIGGHFGQYVGSRTNVRTVLAAVNASNGQVDPNFHPRVYTLYPGAWTISSSAGVLFAGGDFTGVGTGPNAANNKIPYVTAFGSI